MGSHPINLAIRFILELAALIALGYWGWHQGAGILSFILAIGLPVIAAVLWGTFAVPEDPSRSGKAPVAVPGLLRLALEIGILGSAVWALYDLKFTQLGLAIGLITLVHYVVSYDRLLWLVQQKMPSFGKPDHTFSLGKVGQIKR